MASKAAAESAFNQASKQNWGETTTKYEKGQKKRDQRMREPVPGFAEERSLGTQFSCKLTVKEKQFSDQEK